MLDESVTREIFGNVDVASKWIFYALATLALASFGYGLFRRIRLWRFGKPTRSERGQQPEQSGLPARFLVVGRRIVDLLLQRTLYNARTKASVAHSLLFGGFVLLLVGTILVAIEHYAAAAMGREATQPLFHKGLYFAVYEVVLETAGVALIVGVFWFMRRRMRADSSIGHNWSDWFVLSSLLLLGVTGFVTEATRIINEQTPHAAFSYVGLGVASLLDFFGLTRSGANALHFGLWWVHAILALGLIAVFPYTRLLHALAGGLNLLNARERLGTMMPIQLEDVEETGLVGVASITDFTRRQLLELDACVSCGRCQDVCPAFEAGKPLSPRDVVQDLRTVLNTLEGNGEEQGAGSTSSAASLHEIVAAETAWSCTTCHACVQTCPLGVNPLRFLTDLRRNLVGEGHLRGAPATALQKTQRSGNPWGLPADARLDWAAGLQVPTVEDQPDFDILYWVGCAAAYDRRIQRVARAMVRLLNAADVNFAVLGPAERCTGESARRMGDEFLFQELANSNLEQLEKNSVKRIVTHCPHCLNSFKNDYPQFGGRFEVLHHSQFLAELVRQGALKIPRQDGNAEDAETLTYHDPCYLARVNGVTADPRSLIQLTLPESQQDFVELPRHGQNTACCGAGGGRMWFDDAADTRTGVARVTEVTQSGAGTLVVGCPFCLTMLQDGLAAQESATQAKDVAELLAEALDLND